MNFYVTYQFVFISTHMICVAYLWLRVNKVFIMDRGRVASSTIEKYEKREFWTVKRGRDCVRYGEGRCSKYGTCPKKTRFFGDKHCLTMYFDNHEHWTNGCDFVPSLYRVEEDYISSVEWVLGGKGCGMHMCAEDKIYNDADIVTISYASSS